MTKEKGAGKELKQNEWKNQKTQKEETRNMQEESRTPRKENWLPAHITPVMLRENYSEVLRMIWIMDQPHKVGQ